MSRVANGESTRQKILLTALDLYAQRGLDGVSLRTISAQSGTRNSAAAHYHFGNRLGVIEAVLSMITSHLRPGFDAGIKTVEQTPQPTLREVVCAMSLPYLSLLSGKVSWGPAALRFMAHLHADNTRPIVLLLKRHFRLEVERIECQLHRALPDVPRNALRVRLAFSFVNLIHGAAEIDLLANTPFGDIRPDDVTLFNHFVDYVEGGLGFPSRQNQSQSQSQGAAD